MEDNLKNNENLDSLKVEIQNRDEKIKNLHKELLYHEKNGDNFHIKVKWYTIKQLFKY